MTTTASTPTAPSYSQKEVDGIISYNIKMLLADRGLSQTSLGEALGLKRSAMSLKLNGRSTWYAIDMVNAANFLNVSLDTLLDDSLMKQMQRLQNKRAGTGFGPRLFVAYADFNEYPVPRVGLEPTLYRF